VSLVGPEFFNLQRAPASVLSESEQLQANSEAVGNVAVQLDRHFATAPLRLAHAGQSNKLAGNS